MRTLFCAVGALCLGLCFGFGCGGNGDGEPDAGDLAADAGANVDAGHPDAGHPDAGQDVDAGTMETCLLNTTEFGDLGALDVQVASPLGGFVLTAPITSNSPPDKFELGLFSNTSIFPEPVGLKTGTFDLGTASETQYHTCGACVRILANLRIEDPQDPVADQFYMVTGGTLELTSVPPGRITGSVKDLTFQRVIMNSGYVSTPVGNCKSAIGSASFDVAVP
jgi:hypothetical protein